MICKRCFRMSDDDAKVCPYCGMPLTDDADSNTDAGDKGNESKKEAALTNENTAPATDTDTNEYGTAYGNINGSNSCGNDIPGTPDVSPSPSINSDYHVPQGGNYSYGNQNYMPPYGWQRNLPPPYVPPVKRPQTKAGKFFSGVGHAAAYVALFFFCQIVVSVAVYMIVTFGISYSTTQEYMEMYGSDVINDRAFLEKIENEVANRAYDSMSRGEINNVISIASSVLTIVSVMLVAASKHRPISEHIELYPPRSWKILLLFPAAVAVWFIVIMIINVIPWPDAVVEQFNSTYDFIDNSPLWLSVISTVIAAPIVEEIIFRACLHGRLRRGMPTLAAGIISAFIFGLAHGAFIAILYATLLGLMLVYVYEKFGTILAPMLFHIGFNSANYIMLPVFNDDTDDMTVLIILGASAVVFIICAAVIMLSDVGRKESKDNTQEF